MNQVWLVRFCCSCTFLQLHCVVVCFPAASVWEAENKERAHCVFSDNACRKIAYFLLKPLLAYLVCKKSTQALQGLPAPQGSCNTAPTSWLPMAEGLLLSRINVALLLLLLLVMLLCAYCRCMGRAAFTAMNFLKQQRCLCGGVGVE